MHFEIYEAKDGWRWRLRAANGRIIADSGEAYVTCSNARGAVSDLKLGMANGDAPVECLG